MMMLLSRCFYFPSLSLSSPTGVFGCFGFLSTRVSSALIDSYSI